MPKLHHNLVRFTGRREVRSIPTPDVEMATKPLLHYNPTGSAAYIERGAAEHDAEYLAQYGSSRVVRDGRFWRVELDRA